MSRGADYVVGKNSGVCELHFCKEDFHDATNKGKERNRKCMKINAFPSIFPDYPK